MPTATGPAAPGGLNPHHLVWGIVLLMALDRLGRPTPLLSRRGRIEHEVLKTAPTRVCSGSPATASRARTQLASDRAPVLCSSAPCQMPLLTTKVKGHRRKVQRCTGRLLSGTIKITTNDGNRATISRGRGMYATGESAQVGPRRGAATALSAAATPPGPLHADCAHPSRRAHHHRPDDDHDRMRLTTRLPGASGTRPPIVLPPRVGSGH